MMKSFALFALGAAAICATGCNKAAGRANDQVSVTHTTSAELPLRPATPAPTGDDYLSAVRREQIELKGRLDDELGSIDQRLGDLRQAGKGSSPESHDLMERRRTLDADALVLARADERGWDELKATLEHDLEEPGP